MRIENAKCRNKNDITNMKKKRKRDDIKDNTMMQTNNQKMMRMKMKKNKNKENNDNMKMTKNMKKRN